MTTSSRQSFSPSIVLLIFSVVSLWTGKSAAAADEKAYIVHCLGSQRPEAYANLGDWYQATLGSVAPNRTIIYTYSTVIQGFATGLNLSEATDLRAKPGVIAVLEVQVLQLQTTRTPEFLGLDPANGLLREAKEGNNIIIGMLDTGVWPESKCFDDHGLGPVPEKWTGKCLPGTNFTSSNCNKKLIGAQFFYKGYEAMYGAINETLESKSARDDIGHGTHTACTAGGTSVSGANLFGYAPGKARGMATRARIAAYKVCWGAGYCTDADILAGMDQAVRDGVDVISMSIGASPQYYYADSIAIGAFTAMQRGVFVSCAGGNAGPGSRSVTNVAPWIMTVAASTIDRDFPAYAVIKDTGNYTGSTLYVGKNLPAMPTIPLIYAGNASNYSDGSCSNGSLIPEMVEKKIVLCDGSSYISSVEQGFVLKALGALGMILANSVGDGVEGLLARPHVLPATTLGRKDGDELRANLISNPNATGTILTSGNTRIGFHPAPVVATFSSRGPNTISPQIMKPDVIAPGVNILAGWSGNAPPSSLPYDERRVDFNIISGTSMACPHVSGLAALLRAARSEWSPAAIKSALMTTAYSTYKDGITILDANNSRPCDSFCYGAGHVDPQKALDPGLLYDLIADDYLEFLCEDGYTADQITVIAGRTYTCAGTTNGLNYPTFVARFATGTSGQTVTFTRTATNVGPATSSYTVSTLLPSPVKVVVQPEVLSFNRTGQKLSYTVSFMSTLLPSSTTKFGYLEWCDRTRIVHSPIAFTWS